MENFTSLITQNELNSLHSFFYNNFIIKNNNIKIDIEYDKKSLERIDIDTFAFIIHKNDTCIADCIRTGILYEKFVLSFLKQFINPNKNILDIGANIGTHSIIYSNYTNKIVYSFEPQKIIYDILEHNIKLNNCNNVNIYNLGISNIKEEYFMNAEYNIINNFGAYRIDKNLDESNGLKIKCDTIDSMNIEDVGYIKIDVEGHEYEALLGIENLLKRDKPLMFIEIHDSCETRINTLNFLSCVGYKYYYKLSHCDYIFSHEKIKYKKSQC